ncbi:hypothetical protein CEXT_194251 [Caerostris extrusa]|uniref:Alpha-latrotoxin n=1 Tax=Caerostris extrusa TaxID=172846 RepID=A0AAV4MM81_CAEEX|nr:hypothetical protein CEXT_194251 [Caerostris extrusa]
MTVDDVDKENRTPLHLASQKGHSRVVEVLLNFNASCSAKDKRGYSPVHYAIRNGHEECGMLLLDKEVNVDANVTDCGLSPLHIAVESCKLNFVQHLLKKKANVNSMSDRCTTPCT